MSLLVAQATGEPLLPEKWLPLTTQPAWAIAVERLRNLARQIQEAEAAGDVAQSETLQAEVLAAEAYVIHVTERLHEEVRARLDSSTAVLVRAALSALAEFIRLREMIAHVRNRVLNTGFSLTAVPHQPAIASILSADFQPALSLLVGQAAAIGVITTPQEAALLRGEGIETGFSALQPDHHITERTDP